MNLWIVIAGMGLITFGFRIALIIGANRFHLPQAVEQALKYAPVAVLSAIIVPELIAPGGDANLSLYNSRLLAGIVAIAVAWRTRNVLTTIVAGMIVLWLLQWLFGATGG